MRRMRRMGRMGRMGQDARWETSGVWLTGRLFFVINRFINMGWWAWWGGRTKDDSEEE